LEADAYTYYFEGTFSALSGLIPKGIGSALRPPDIHFPATSLVCIENTYNRAGGKVWTPSQIKAVFGFAHSRGLKVHMDGARIFNAAISQDIDVEELTQFADSKMEPDN